MDFLTLLKQRRACHHFLAGQKISDADLTEMIRRTSLTPSGYNRQPWEFVIVREPKNIAKVSDIAFKQEHIKDASALIVVLGDMDIGRYTEEILQNWIKNGYCTREELPAYRNSIGKTRSPEKRRDMALRNSMLACMTLMFVAEDMGYGTCPMMGFSQWQLQEFLNIPDDRLISLLIAVGKPDRNKEKPQLPRREAKEMIHWEFFQ